MARKPKRPAANARNRAAARACYALARGHNTRILTTARRRVLTRRGYLVSQTPGMPWHAATAAGATVDPYANAAGYVFYVPGRGGGKTTTLRAALGAYAPA